MPEASVIATDSTSSLHLQLLTINFLGSLRYALCDGNLAI